MFHRLTGWNSAVITKGILAVMAGLALILIVGFYDPTGLKMTPYVKYVGIPVLWFVCVVYLYFRPDTPTELVLQSPMEEIWERWMGKFSFWLRMLALACDTYCLVVIYIDRAALFSEWMNRQLLSWIAGYAFVLLILPLLYLQEVPPSTETGSDQSE